MARAARADVAVIGAGPYGLATAAHLASAGAAVSAFGEPMESWDRHMPDGMLLRSRWDASHIGSPDRTLKLDDFWNESGFEPQPTIPVERFVAYGRWFQQRAVPQLDRRRVRRLIRSGDRFTLELDDGERVEAARVVVAAGIVPFAWRPPELGDLPRELVSHTADHSSLAGFAGRRVAVIGGGQSALESAALLAEGGAEVTLVVRADTLAWLQEQQEEDLPWQMYAYARIGIGGPRSSWLAAMPELFRHLPRSIRDPLARRCTPPPCGATWLKPRLTAVDVTLQRNVQAVSRQNGHLELRFQDGGTLEADHVLLATGYRVDLARYEFLDEELRKQLRVYDGRPVLRDGLEASVPGLHFVGASAADTFGPVMRFVCGTWAAARAVTRRIVGRRAPRTGFTW